jgi:hypothetical protein
MTWHQRSVHGRAVALRALSVAFILAVGSLLVRFGSGVVVVGILCAFPVAVVYYGIGCPRCGERMLSPWQFRGDPRSCPNCGLPTNQSWSLK